jgi:hypothetical protein
MKWLGQHIYDQVSRFRNEVFIENSDLTIYKPINDDPAIINLGSSATERLEIKALVASGTQEVNAAYFTTYTASTTGNRGRFVFYVDETSVLQIMDAGLNLAENKGLQINNTDIITDSSGTATLNNIDALDSTTIATFNSALTAGDITGVRITTDTGIGGVASVASGSADFSILGASGIGVTNSGVTITAVAVPGEIDHDSLLNFAADEHFTQANITTVGTIGTGVWQGTAIATAYIADDAVTGDKLADALLAEIEANTAKATNVSTNLSQTNSFESLRIESSDGDNIIIAEASSSIAGVMTVAHHDKLEDIEIGATADQSKSDINGLAITTVGTIDSGVWNGSVIADAYLSTNTAHLDTTQTFTGAKTFTDTLALTGTGRITGIDTVSAATDAASKTYVDAHVWDGNDITSGTVVSARLDADTAHLTTDQTFTGVKTFNEAINKKSLNFIFVANKFVSSTANETYFSLGDSDRDVQKGSEDAVGVVAVMPCNGILRQVEMVTSSNLSGRSWTYRLYRIPSGTAYTSEILVATVAASAGAAGNTNATISLVTDPGDGTNDITYETGYSATTMFTKGDRALFSLQSNSDAAGTPKINTTFCFELDESTI